MNESGRPFSLPTRAEARHAPRLAAPGPVTRRCLVSIHIAWVRRAEEAMRHRPHLACSNVIVPDRRFGRARIDDAGMQHIRTRRGRSRVALTSRHAPHNCKPIASIDFSAWGFPCERQIRATPQPKIYHLHRLLSLREKAITTIHLRLWIRLTPRSASARICLSQRSLREKAKESRIQRPFATGRAPSDSRIDRALRPCFPKPRAPRDRPSSALPWRPAYPSQPPW